MHRFANPNRFLKIADRAMPWAVGLMVLAFGSGLTSAFRFATRLSTRRNRSNNVYPRARSLDGYIHLYYTMALASAATLIWKHPLAVLSAKAAAPIGAGFTIICLATGSLWGNLCGALGGCGMRGLPQF